MQVSELIESGAIPFPYKKLTYKTDPSVYLDRLRKYVYSISNSPYKLVGTSLPAKYKGRPTYFKYNSADYENIDIVTDLFTEYARVKAKVGKQSPFDYFRDNAISIISQLLKQKMPITPHNLREYIYNQVREATQFKATLAYSVYKYFRARKVLDPSAGWGDRLIGAIAANVDYTGYDPNTDLQVGHDEIISKLGDNTKQRIIYQPFESAVITDKYDLVFTSPPFFDLEVYSNQTTQSISSYPNYDVWLRKFLLASMDKCMDVLLPQGHLVLHLSNFGGHDITEAVHEHLTSRDDVSYLGIIGTEGASGRVFPMLVFQKV